MFTQCCPFSSHHPLFFITSEIWQHRSYWFWNHKLLRSLYHRWKQIWKATDITTEHFTLSCPSCNPVWFRWYRWFVRIWCSWRVLQPGRWGQAEIYLLWAHQNELTTWWVFLTEGISKLFFLCSVYVCKLTKPSHRKGRNFITILQLQSDLYH